MKRTRREFIAQDQHGHLYGILEHPRKDLMHMLGNKHASIMYVDTIYGKPRKAGYIIGGLWLDVFEIIPMFQFEEEKKGLKRVR